jgi:hypothetical protein
MYRPASTQRPSPWTCVPGGLGLSHLPGSCVRPHGESLQPMSPTPRQILDTLWPFLQVAAAYARDLQVRIRAHPAKTGADNPFAAALTDADLSIQTLLEVAVLGSFPTLRFYGEEEASSYNTRYFHSRELGPLPLS